MQTSIDEDVIFTILAVNKKYVEYAKRLIHRIHTLTSSRIVVVTNLVEDIRDVPHLSDRLFVYDVPSEEMLHTGTKSNFNSTSFNYNIKYLALKNATKHESKYVVYLDCDWQINPITRERFFYNINYEIDKLEGRSDYGKKKFDSLVNRNWEIGLVKTLGQSWESEDRLKLHKVYEHNDLDFVNCPNEQWFVFRNNDKLKVMAGVWSYMERQIRKNDFHAFAEGIEIGLAMHFADMTYVVISMSESSYSFYNEIQNKYFNF